jgi:hypothetical protein
LGEDDFALAKFKYRFSFAYLGEKIFGVENLIGLVWHVGHGSRWDAPMLAIFRTAITGFQTKRPQPSWGRIHRMTLGKAIRQYITK